MPYSDQDALVATQIAYYDLKPDLIAGKGNNATLRELLTADGSILKKLQDAIAAAEKDAGGDQNSLEVIRLKNAEKLYQDILDGDSKYGDWIIKDVRNDNDNSGFFGCLIETSPGNAIIGFRGSESNTPMQTEKDWVKADFGLLNSTLTDQQRVATEYMDYINKHFDYDSFATTGHSLGGNLSSHATITAPEDMKAKIIQSFNFDGPGFSEEYLKLHGDDFSKVSDKITHYQWSLVGNLLNRFPGENFKTIATNDYVDGIYTLEALTRKHDTSFVIFDENGMVIPGEMDNFARSIGELSRNIDSCPSWMGDALVWALGGIITMTPAEKAVAGGVVIAGMVAFAVVNPVMAGIGLVAAAAVAVAGFIDSDFFGKTLIPFLADTASTVIDVVQAVADGIGKIVGTVVATMKLVAETAKKVVDAVVGAVKKLFSWFKKSVNVGAKYAASHPYIRVNTYKLRYYADRLASINSRVAQIDRRMDSLYKKVDLLDLIDLIKADVFTGYSNRIRKCVNYLNDTASDFEGVETRILGQISKA